MATSTSDRRAAALADLLARWATQPVLRDRLVARLETRPLEAVADLVGVEPRALTAKRKRAAHAAARRLLALLRTIAAAETKGPRGFRMTADGVRPLLTGVVATLGDAIGPLTASAAGSVSTQAGNEEICRLRTKEVEDRYRDVQDALQRWDQCVEANDVPLDQLPQLETVCAAELMNLYAAGEAYLTARYNQEIACAGLDD